ncbi:MAG: hypothetical protein M0Z53_09395 [Thermaerobacter sp.]|nr:hypothetical protein [Thermaerobacter sp.]
MWAKPEEAAHWRQLYFPPTVYRDPTIIVLNWVGVFPTPGFVEEFLVPLARAIPGGAYGNLTLVVRTHDPGVYRFIQYLGRVHGLPIYVELVRLGVHGIAYDAEVSPAIALTKTEQDSLEVIREHRTGMTSSQVALEEGIAQTAALNRLSKLAEKRMVMRFAMPGRAGDVYVDPIAVVKMFETTSTE